MLAALSLPVASWLLGYSWPVIVFARWPRRPSIFLHRGNLKRLLHGEENRFVAQEARERANLVRRHRASEALELELADRCASTASSTAASTRWLIRVWPGLGVCAEP